MTEDSEKQESRSKRLARWRRPVVREARPNRAYSRFVRWMRLILPLIAIGIVGLLMSWPGVDDVMVTTVPENAMVSRAVGKNELINPRFESEDDRKQPFTITATRAIQSAKNPDIVFLEAPMADIVLQSGTWLAAEAKRGAYHQDTEKLLLEGNVKLFHDQGYEVITEKLLINLKTRQAWGDQAIHGQGPAGTLEATGMKARSDTGQLIFTGPVKLVLNRAIEGL